MRRQRTTWIAAFLACLLTSCDHREAPVESAARQDVPRREQPAAPESTQAAQPAAPTPLAAPALPAAPAEPDSARAAPSTPPTPPAPRAPTLVIATPVSPSQIALSWQVPPDSAAPAGYEVFRDESLVASATEPRFTDERLRPWSRHCYAVRSYDARGLRSARSPAACAQTLDDTRPTAPGELHAEAQPGDAVKLTWLPSTDDVGVEKYEVLRGDRVIGKVKSPGFLERSLAPTKEYCYVVRALDFAANRSAPAGPACVVVPDTTPPTIPTAVSATPDGEHAIVLGWRASTDDVGVARYELAPDGEAPRTASSGEQLTTRHDGLAVATRHCYGLRACDAAGNCSAWSAPVCATTPDLTAPTPPRSPSAIATGDTAIEVRWGASTDNVGVTGYELLRGNAVVARTDSATTARETGLHPAQRYCYTVRAHDLAGNSSILSAEACVTTPDLTPPLSLIHI